MNVLWFLVATLTVLGAQPDSNYLPIHFLSGMQILFYIHAKTFEDLQQEMLKVGMHLLTSCKKSKIEPPEL